MNQIRHNNKGFTIIELMAVVSIVSILAVIALSAYTDYVVRSKVSEGMVFAAEAKTSVSSYYYNLKAMPANNAQAGLMPEDAYNDFNNIRRLEISSTPEPGTITVTFKIPETKADNKKLQLVPSTMKGIVFWRCESTAVDGLDNNQAPPNCRG